MRRIPCLRARARWLAAALAAVTLLAAPQSRAVEVGQPVPAFSAPSLQGKQTLSPAAFKGKVVYIDFWASWCAPCAQAIPKLEALRSEFAGEPFQILAVNVDKDPDKGRSFLELHPIGYPSASDPDGKLPELFGLRTMPSSYLIDRKGRVHKIHEGFKPADIDTLRAEIRALLGKKP